MSEQQPSSKGESNKMKCLSCSKELVRSEISIHSSYCKRKKSYVQCNKALDKSNVNSELKELPFFSNENFNNSCNENFYFSLNNNRSFNFESHIDKFKKNLYWS